ncbi:hypothetical protein CRX42_01645 [Pseudomonas jessenii]|uniref:Uncharacterized protein n=1 Tax=Pseudomonas jessenii TaxID=77298 RepID=A0A2W0EXQ1_PSEJE|nr:hypothetical protein CRX42_01645 [Pseudomonas jessenii]
MFVLFLFSHVLTRIPQASPISYGRRLRTLLLILSGWVFFGESMTLAHLTGIALIVGVILINRTDGPQA